MEDSICSHSADTVTSSEDLERAAKLMDENYGEPA